MMDDGWMDGWMDGFVDEKPLRNINNLIINSDHEIDYYKRLTAHNMHMNFIYSGTDDARIQPNQRLL